MSIHEYSGTVNAIWVWLRNRAAGTEAYDGRNLDEPSGKVWRRVAAAGVAALFAALLGLWLDRIGWHPAICGDSPCRWFQRSGALIVVCGTYLAFKSGAVLIKWIQSGTQNAIYRANPKQSRHYGIFAFLLLFTGTIIWDFGDWI